MVSSGRPTTALLIITVLCAITIELTCGAPRVRKEIRSLTDTEYKLFVQGLSTMLSVGTEAGQKIFGPKYKEYDYFIVKHAVAVYDPRGDQGHGNPCFMTFHRAIILEFEEALLSVVPELKAMPYWSLPLDTAGGNAFYNTSKSIFSSQYAGSLDGLKENNYQVADGVFAWRQVPLFNNDTYGKYADIYSGSTSTGLLRSPDNSNPNKYITRYPYSLLTEVDPSTYYGEYTNYSQVWWESLQAGFGMNFTEADYKLCTDPTFATTWVEWLYCADYNTLTTKTTPTPYLLKFTKSLSGVLHSYAHWLVGSKNSWTDMGEMFDVATSPNEPFLFFPHHGNVDRSNMIWQRNAVQRNASMGYRSVMWGYPRSNVSVPGYNEGCYLNDVVNKAFPFTDLPFRKPPSSKDGYTHFDILDNLRPGNNIYTYDIMYKE